MCSYQPVSSIAIVGAGPVGVAFAKYLVAEKAFAKIQIFEQRDGVGGIWNLSEPARSRKIPVPQTNPRYGHQSSDETVAGVTGLLQSQSESLEFESPLYDYLETNIPKGLMAHTDNPFPRDSPLFPSHQEVLQYLEEYAAPVKSLISFQHQVRKVERKRSLGESHDVWCVEVQNLKSGVMHSNSYDAVVIANGHYTVPSLPRIEGIEQWNTTYPGAILHSKAYRRPEDYTGRKVLVIGNSASGLDIAFQVGRQCKQPILLSSRSVSAFGTMPASPWKRDVDEVVEFLDASKYERAVRLKSGGIETDIEAVIFATGYFYSFPFLSGFEPPVVTDGLRIQGVYQHLFHMDHPSLVFPVINLKVIPFPLAENQAAVVSRVWAGRLNLPSKDKMRAWEQDTVKLNGNGKYFHLKKFPEDAAQINELYRWAKTASKAQGLENDGQGKLGTEWNEQQVWTRSKFPEIKGAYVARGAERVQVTTIEELGFDFDIWRKSAKPDDLAMFEAAGC